LEDFTVLKQTELLNIAGSTVGVVTKFISAIAAVSLLVGGVSIMDIMWVSVSERTREIGIRKAIGATNRQILSQFLVEGSLLSVFGGLIGIIVSLIINLLLRLYTSLHPAITVPIMVLAVFISVVVGIIFSVAPALKAARKRPIDALRGE
jgi:putative ABC transport system permease protein